jgi:hypothetical protein
MMSSNVIAAVAISGMVLPVVMLLFGICRSTKRYWLTVSRLGREERFSIDVDMSEASQKHVAQALDEADRVVSVGTTPT